MVSLAILVIGYLAWPILFTSSGFAQDWSIHLWYLWRQSISIEAGHSPDLFLDDGGSAFYPFYAFYGGTVYSVFGTLAIVLGSPVAAYVVSYLLGFAAAYAGWYSLARLTGLGRWQAQIPGLVFITSSYYLTLIYARGDWPEFIAVSSLPATVAALVRVLLAEHLSLRWAAALVISALLFFGSHNLTMLWGVTALVISGLIVAATIPQTRRLVSWRGLFRVAALVTPAALVNAWYLLPAIAYGQRT